MAQVQLREKIGYALGDAAAGGITWKVMSIAFPLFFTNIYLWCHPIWSDFFFFFLYTRTGTDRKAHLGIHLLSADDGRLYCSQRALRLAVGCYDL